MKRDILGVQINYVTLNEAIDVGRTLLDAPGFHYVVTPNPEFILVARKDQDFRRVLNNADLALPDGIGVVYAAKILGTPLRERVPGVDFAQQLIALITGSSKKLFLLGAKPGVAEKAAHNLQGKYPGLNICGVHDGYFQEDGPVTEAIRASEADVVFVCLGAPKQELWMSKFGPETGARLMIGLGGCLDVFAGNVQRAPEFWQKAGLEWLYRLFKEPSRIGRMAKLPLILIYAAAERLKRK